jgi:2,3-bisphosphoglycerate-independent phosphoglycerate mutase
MGNSEVGHLNLGAGRIVYQDIVRIDKAIADGSFYENPTLIATIEAAKASGGTLHLFGLTSPGNVHASLDHAYAICELAKRRGLTRVAWHAFLDGRDTPPASGRDICATSASAWPPSASASWRRRSAAITRWIATNAGTGWRSRGRC